MRLRALNLFILMVGIGFLQATLSSDRERMELKGPVQQYTVSLLECDITHYFFDQSGNLQKISTENFRESAKPVYLAERELDESGRLSRLSLRSESGTLIPYQSFSYHPDGSLRILEIHNWYDASYSEKQFDESGRMQCTKWYGNDQSLSSELVCEYNEMGQLVSETQISQDTEYASSSVYDRHSTFQYDAQGRITRKESRLRIGGARVEVLRYQYDAQGRIGRIIHEGSEEGTWEEEFSYDRFGNVTNHSIGMEGASSPGYDYEYYPE